MDDNERQIIVSTRRKSELSNLAMSNGPLASPCGSAGPWIAKKVLEGGGSAVIPMHMLELALDTQSGIEGILDNFALQDYETKKPLIHYLVGEFLTGHCE